MQNSDVRIKPKTPKLDKTARGIREREIRAKNYLKG